MTADYVNAADYLLGPEALARHGHRTALICGNASVDYVRLAQAVQHAAGAWRALGAAQGDRILIQLPDTPEFAAAWLGALYAGAVAIAVNGRLPAEELRYMYADSGASLFLAETGSVPKVHEFCGERCVDLDAWRVALNTFDAMTAPARTRAEDAAFWLYSSGTTGRPKGIVHTHAHILPAGQAMNEVLGIAEGDLVFGTSKLFFAYGLEHGLLGPLAIGAASILHPDTSSAADAVEIIARHSPKAFFSVPSFYRRLLALDRSVRPDLHRAASRR